MSAASGRMSSASTTVATASSPAGSSPAAASVGAPASSSTRNPWSAKVVTLAIAALSDATSTSGAPTYHTPSPPNETAVNLCAESNGMCSSTVQPGTSG